MEHVLFNIFLYDLLIIVYEFASHANSKTLFFVDADIYDAISKFQNASGTLFQWFNNQTKANPGKCHFIYSSNVNIM